MELKVKRLHHKAKLPEYATDGAACFDIRALIESETVAHSLWDGEGLVFNTGLAFEIPQDHVMLVFSRSGQGFKSDVRLANCVGVIDSDYRGELKVKLTRDSNNFDYERKAFLIEDGDRIAQAMVIPVKQVQFKEVNELSDTKRGSNGLGSTGV